MLLESDRAHHYSLQHWLHGQLPPGNNADDADAYADALQAGFVRGVLLPARCAGRCRAVQCAVCAAIKAVWPVGAAAQRAAAAAARNELGNAVRMGALLLEGDGPYKQPGDGAAAAAGAWWAGFPTHSLAARQCEGLKALKEKVRRLMSHAFAFRHAGTCVLAVSIATGCAHRCTAAAATPCQGVCGSGWSLRQLAAADVEFFGDGVIFLDMVRGMVD